MCVESRMHDEPHLLDQSKAFKYHTFVLDVWCSKLNLKRKSLVYHIHIHIHFIWAKLKKQICLNAKLVCHSKDHI